MTALSRGLKMLSIPAFLLISIFLFSCGGNTPAEKGASEIRNEIENMEGQAETKTVGGQCGEDLDQYTKNVDILLALTKEKAAGDNSEELKAKMEKAQEELKKLSKKIESHPELLMNRECANAWATAQLQYAQYIQNNLSDFVPKK
jgi:Zn-dependent oligopeptidase